MALPRIIVKRWPGSGVDVLVNNVGLGRNNAALWDGSTASWVEMISTNVLGVCMCTREALKVLSPLKHTSSELAYLTRSTGAHRHAQGCFKSLLSRSTVSDLVEEMSGPKWKAAIGKAAATQLILWIGNVCSNNQYYYHNIKVAS